MLYFYHMKKIIYTFHYDIKEYINSTHSVTLAILKKEAIVKTYTHTYTLLSERRKFQTMDCTKEWCLHLKTPSVPKIFFSHGCSC